MASIFLEDVAELPVTKPAIEKIAEASRKGAKHRLPRLGGWRVLVAIVAAAALAGFGYWWTQLRPVNVSVAPVQTNVPEQVFGLGSVGARVRSNVGFKVAGVLDVLDADQGDVVPAGQELARLDARDIEAQVTVMEAGIAQAQANIAKARADVTAATANLANAKVVSARRTSLADKGVVSAEEAETNQTAVDVAAANLVEAESGVAVAEAALQSAKAQVASTQATLANYTLFAPYDAWVISRNLELGSAVNIGQAVFTLVAANSVWVESYIDERLAGQLSVGQPAEIILRSDPNTRFPGHVARIEIQSDSVNEERLVDVAFDKIPANVHLAEQAEVVVTAGTLPRAILVPPAAVLAQKQGRGTVWTVEDGRLGQQQVAFGPPLLDGKLPIVGGVPDSARVVTVLAKGLRIGRSARIVQAQTP
jgi:HlyD family secretion protein